MLSNRVTHLISFLKKAFFKCRLLITDHRVTEITTDFRWTLFKTAKNLYFKYLQKPYELLGMYAETNLLALAQVTNMDGLVVIIDRCTGEVWCGAVGLWTWVRSMAPSHARQNAASDWTEVRDRQWKNRIFEADGWHGMNQTFSTYDMFCYHQNFAPLSLWI